MNELDTLIWDKVHEWCNDQSCEIPDQNRRALMDEIKALVLSNISGSFPAIDWDKLRKEFFHECTDKTFANKYSPSIKKVSVTPHDLFEWFRKKLAGNVSGQSKRLQECSHRKGERCIKPSSCYAFGCNKPM